MPGLKGTIKSSKDIDFLFKHGRRINSDLLSIRVCELSKECDRRGRVAFIAGKKLGNAVFRNRCKRVMRAMYSRNRGPWENYDVAFIARSRKISTASAEELDKACRTVIGRLRG